MHDIKYSTFEYLFQFKDISDFELYIRDPSRCGFFTSLGEDVSWEWLDACDVSCGPDEGGEIESDGARSAAYVEDAHVWFDVWEEVGCRVLGGAPAVGA